MRIAFDGTTLQPRRTGVGYYTEHLLHHLAQEASDDELTVVAHGAIETPRGLPDRVRVVLSKPPIPRVIWMQMFAAHALSRVEADVAHFTNSMLPIAASTPTVVTIHDMSLTLFPQHHPRRRVLLNRPLMERAARRADAVITVSESAKRDVVRLLDVAPDRVHVIHEAAAPSFRPVRDPRALERVRRRYGLGERIVLNVGRIEPRKNVPMLVEAFARRRQSGDLSHQLVCVGPSGWLSDDLARQIHRLNIDDAIKFTGYVPFEDLPALYSLAELFVFPSVYEGFGLPVIEAMACGTPVITSSAPALAEVGDGAVQQVDPLDASSLGDAIVALARSRERRDHLSKLGLARASAFSWKRAARETLEVYRQAVAHRAGAGVPDVTPFAEVGVEPAANSRAPIREYR